ncbi:MAG: hypothetical protein ACR2MQ_07950 [Gemmatimonadaceae bacterium]
MRKGQAFGAGVAGGIVMVSAIWLVRTFLGIPVDLAMVEGTMFLPKGPSAWILGLIIHLVISGLIGLIYAWGFETITHRAGALVGASFSLVHAVIAGLLFGTVPTFHPRIPEAMPAPGMFLSNLGVMGVIAFFVFHAIYGAVTGAIYHPEHADARARDGRMRPAAGRLGPER